MPLLWWFGQFSFFEISLVTEHAPRRGVLHVAEAVRPDPAGEPADDRPQNNFDPGEKR